MLKIDNKIPTIIFLSTLISTFSFGNIYFLSTQSPDFVRYRNYIDYLILGQKELALEQGFAYFLIISLFVKNRLKNYGTVYENEINNIGEQTNFSYFNLSRFENSYNLGIQEGNFIIYIFGLIGLYYFLKQLNFKNKNILYAFTLINCLPVMFEMRLTLKPEIFAFAIVSWTLYFLEKFSKNKDLLSLFSSILFFSILISTKGSIALMSFLFLFINYYKTIFSLSKSKIVFIFLASVLFSSVLMYENYKITGLNLLTRADINLEYGQLDYDNKASLGFLYNVNFSNLINDPIRDTHADSFIGITLLDTFDDYFNLYWNKDYMLMKIDRKKFIQTSDSGFYFDSYNDVFYVPNAIKFNLDYLRKYIALMLTLSLYVFLFRYYFKYRKKNKLLLGPVIGIFVLLLSSFGIPENNFDPSVGDTVKTFYYGFLLAISLSYLLTKYFKNNSSYAFLKIIFLSLIFFFITGFPKANNTYLDYSVSTTNSQTSLCHLNSIFLKGMLLEDDGINCEKQTYEQICEEIESILTENSSHVFEKEDKLYKYTSINDCIDKFNAGYKLKKFGKNNVAIPIFNTLYIFLQIVLILNVVFSESVKNLSIYKNFLKK